MEKHFLSPGQLFTIKILIQQSHNFIDDLFGTIPLDLCKAVYFRISYLQEQNVAAKNMNTLPLNFHRSASEYDGKTKQG